MNLFRYKMNKTLIIALLITLTALAGCASSESTSEPISKTTLQFGTVIQLTVFDSKDEPALEKALAHMKILENELSTSVFSSNISEFNRAKAGEAVALKNHARAVIDRGLYYSELSEGRFDITIEPVVDLWAIGKEGAHIPSDKELAEALSHVNYRNIEFDKAAGTLKKNKDGIKIDLGAIAKGYAADEAVRILKEEGVEKALVNLGGNVYALGDKDGEPWKVGIQDPLQSTGAMVGIVDVKNTAVITSGVYERYFEEDGVRYHHILDPKSGYPINNELLGISIITGSAIDGDALSTVVYTMGLEKGMAFVENLDGVEAIFVTRDKSIYVSTGAELLFEKRTQEFDLYSASTRQ